MDECQSIAYTKLQQLPFGLVMGKVHWLFVPRHHTGLVLSIHMKHYYAVIFTVVCAWWDSLYLGQSWQMEWYFMVCTSHYVSHTELKRQEKCWSKLKEPTETDTWSYSKPVPHRQWGEAPEVRQHHTGTVHAIPATLLTSMEAPNTTHCQWSSSCISGVNHASTGPMMALRQSQQSKLNREGTGPISCHHWEQCPLPTPRKDFQPAGLTPTATRIFHV